jgi:exosortase
MPLNPSSPIQEAGSPKEKILRISGLLVISGVLFYYYCLHIAYPSTVGNTLAYWTWLACNAKNDFIHGRAIPLVFAVMCWVSWKHARLEERRPSAWGLAGLAMGIGLYVLSVRTIQPRLALFGLPFLILGGLMFMFGPKPTRHFIFPAFIWYFAIPIPGIQQATALLQLVVTKLCYAAGTAMGMPLLLDGNTITAIGPNAWNFDIAEGCSGIRSLMALAMISAVYANYTQNAFWKKLLLFACSLPLALLGNFGRIFTILLLAHFGFKDFAAKTYHDWAGLLIFFPIALAGLFVIDSLLNIRNRVKMRVVRRTQHVESRENPDTSQTDPSKSKHDLQ